MERTWSVGGVYGDWTLTIGLEAGKSGLEDEDRFTAEETRLALRQFCSMYPHFMDVVNLVESRSIGELERNGSRITQWG